MIFDAATAKELRVGWDGEGITTPGRASCVRFVGGEENVLAVCVASGTRIEKWGW